MKRSLPFPHLLALLLLLALTLSGCSILEELNPGELLPVLSSTEASEQSKDPVSEESEAPTTSPEQPTEPPATGEGSIPEGSTEGLTGPIAPNGFDLSAVPAYNGSSPYAVLNGGKPYFTEDEKKQTASFETYAPLDSLGRCGVAYACLGKDLMPTEGRGDIGSVKPSGWQSVQYPNVDGGSLYNRTHLIGFQLAGENANERNLVTGTRYMNATGMLPFENMVADYIKETNKHVLYRITPVFVGNELVPRGVLMEAYSVEDGGQSVCFNVYCYNVQPDITIDYLTGASTGPSFEDSIPEGVTYIINKTNKKLHKPTCSNAKTIKESNREYFYGTLEEALAKGYTLAGCCK